jgi:hypothetical protein
MDVAKVFCVAYTNAVTSVEESVREDMAIIKADPYLPQSLEVLGFVHDTFTGKTNEIS